MNTPNSCLSTAVNNNNVEEVVRILSQKSEHFIKKTGTTYVLGDAAEKGYLKIVQILLDAGIEPNDPNEVLNPAELPLSRAATKGNLEIVRLLVGAGAVINVEWHDYEYLTPLKYAIFGESLEVVIFLVESGADVNEDKYGFTFPLMISAEAIFQSRNENCIRKNQEIYDYLYPLTKYDLCQKADQYFR